MISEKAKSKIDAMSKDAMVAELARGGFSVFNPEKRAYMQSQLGVVLQQEADQHAAQQLGQGTRANELSSIANQIAEKSYRMAAIACVVSVLAVLIAALTYLSGR